MPREKDFKRIVRARMAETGERYTAARSGLRPGAGSGEPLDEPQRLAGVVPMGLGALQAWRRDRPRPVPSEQPTSFGPHWEVSVDAGGRLDVLIPHVLEVGTVTGLGPVLGGVAYVSFGLHMLLPAPEGSDPDDPGPPRMHTDPGLLTPLSAAHAALHRYLSEYLGVEAPTLSGLVTGRLRRHESGVVVPGRSEETVLLGEAAVGGRLGYRLDPTSWPTPSGGMAASPWVAYGVVLHLEREFQTRQLPTDPPPGFTGPYRVAPFIDETFWAALGAALASAAEHLSLPPWPLHQGKVHDPASRIGMAKNWQLPV
jgi:hypothetical protein